MQSYHSKPIKTILRLRCRKEKRTQRRPIHLANKKFRQFAVVLETYSRRRSRNGRNRTHRPIQRTARGTQTFRQSQRLKAEGSLCRVKAEFPFLDKLQYLQYEKISLLRHCRVLWRQTILTIVLQIQWYPVQTTQQYLFSPDRVTVLAASVPTLSPSGYENRWTHRGQ